tara:strand:- start:663 stop:2564 length:1902 start_codon:yes stop_codon:yes gene_type:complete
MDATADLAQAIQDDANQERPGQTKDLVTFWTKLDDVFDEIIGQFPKEEKLNKANVRSFLYQPERLSLNSADGILVAPEEIGILPAGFTDNAEPLFNTDEYFSPFKIIFKKPLLNVKSIQLLSAIIPNPQTSIPNNEVRFSYYTLRNIYSSYVTTALRVAQGAWSSTAPYIVGDVVTYAVPATIQVNSITFSAPYIVQFFTQTSPFVINTGQSFTSSGATTSAYNLTTLNTGSGGSGPGTWFVACTNSGGSGPSSSATLTYVPAANPYNYYVCTSDVTGGSAPNANPSWTLVGQSGTAAEPSYGPWSAITTYSTGLGVFYTPSGQGNTYFYTSVGSGNVGNTPGIVSDGFWTKGGLSPGTAPNYTDIRPLRLDYFELYPSRYHPQEIFYGGANGEGINAIFPDYPTFVNALNAADTIGFSATDAFTFSYNETLNKIQASPKVQVGWTAGIFNNGNYYLLCGWNDPNLIDSYRNTDFIYQKVGYSLNLRCGFTWNGNAKNTANPYTSAIFFNSIRTYMSPWDSYQEPVGFDAPVVTSITANSYPCLIYTQSIRLYCDVTQGSTQDSAGNAGLLSVVPMNTSGLGVTFYQSSFDNDLTKIPSQLQEITISMKTDTGDNYFLPYSANVSLEIAVTYK